MTNSSYSLYTMSLQFSRNLAMVMGRMPAAQLARELGVTTSAVCAWLAGRKMPTVHRLVTIAERFDTTVDALLSEQHP